MGSSVGQSALCQTNGLLRPILGACSPRPAALERRDQVFAFSRLGSQWEIALFRAMRLLETSWRQVPTRAEPLFSRCKNGKLDRPLWRPKDGRALYVSERHRM